MTHDQIILASASEIRAQLLVRAGLPVVAMPAKIDEEAIRAALHAEGASPRDMADHLAEAKAMKLSARFPQAIVIGCDQILALGADVFGKPDDQDQAVAQLRQLQGKTHQLLSAVVIYQAGQPLWRHVGVARMTMRALSDQMLARYVARNWDSIRGAVGAYKIEEEGLKLFAAIEGDIFTVQGLPMLPLLNYLAQRGVIET